MPGSRARGRKARAQEDEEEDGSEDEVQPQPRQRHRQRERAVRRDALDFDIDKATPQQLAERSTCTQACTSWAPTSICHRKGTRHVDPHVAFAPQATHMHVDCMVHMPHQCNLPGMAGLLTATGCLGHARSSSRGPPPCKCPSNARVWGSATRPPHPCDPWRLTGVLSLGPPHIASRQGAAIVL